MAKLITGIALVIFCGFCGYMLTKKYRVRKEFYKQYYAFNRSFLSEISFSRRPLESWLEKQPLSGAFETTVHGFLNALKSGDTALESFESPDFLIASYMNFNKLNVTNCLISLVTSEGIEI